MLGAIAGDIIGSMHEGFPSKQLDFTLFQQESTFTDDTVMTCAVADCLLNQGDYTETLQAYGRRHPYRGYGGMFREWLRSPNPRPYNSYGNGSAMRVSPVGFAFHHIQDVLNEAQASAAVTHDHPEGIKGAQAVAAAIFWARKGWSKEEIRTYIAEQFGYDMNRSCEQIRPTYQFDVTCQGSVPEAIIAFLDSESVEHAIRLAVSLGGDADTQACIAGGIAQAYYRAIPTHIVEQVKQRLTPDLWEVVKAFEKRFDVQYEVF